MENQNEEQKNKEEEQILAPPKSQDKEEPVEEKSEKEIENDSKYLIATEKYIDAIGWSLFFLLIGLVLLVPQDNLYEGVGVIIFGFIILGVQIAKFIKKIKTSAIMIIIGLLALAFGVIALLGVEMPTTSIALIVIGFGILLNSILNRSRMKEEM
jgi:hypothetical protein